MSFQSRARRRARVFRKQSRLRSMGVRRLAPRFRGYARIGGNYGRYRSGGENKFHDIDVDDAVIAINGTIQNAGTVNIIPQGTSEIERDGRKCTVNAINWRYVLSIANVGVGTGSDVIRVILYLDTQCNGTAATVTQILESDNYQSYRNLSNSTRFNILLDRTHIINVRAGSGRGSTDTLNYADVHQGYTFYKKCNIPLEFDSTLGALTEIRSNNIGVLILSKDGATVAFESKLRLRFSG